MYQGLAGGYDLYRVALQVQQGISGQAQRVLDPPRRAAANIEEIAEF
jgi:hypothetical protein